MPLARATTPRALVMMRGSPSSAADSNEATRNSSTASGVSRKSAASKGTVSIGMSQLSRQKQRRLDVPLLRRLVAASEHDDPGAVPLKHIHPIARADVDPQFADALAYGLDVAPVSKLKPGQPVGDPGQRPSISQS